MMSKSSLSDYLIDSAKTVGLGSITEYKDPLENDPYYHCELSGCFDEQGTARQMFKHINSYAHKQTWLRAKFTDHSFSTRESIDKQLGSMDIVRGQTYKSIVSKAGWKDCKKARLRVEFLPVQSLSISKGLGSILLQNAESTEQTEDIREFKENNKTEPTNKLSDTIANPTMAASDQHLSQDGTMELLGHMTSRDDTVGNQVESLTLHDATMPQEPVPSSLSDEAVPQELLSSALADIAGPQEPVCSTPSDAVVTQEDATCSSSMPELESEATLARKKMNFKDYLRQSSAKDKRSNTIVPESVEEIKPAPSFLSAHPVQTAPATKKQPEQPTLSPQNLVQPKQEKTELYPEEKNIKAENRPKDLLRSSSTDMEEISSKIVKPKAVSLEPEFVYKSAVFHFVNDTLLRYYKLRPDKCNSEDIKIHSQEQFTSHCRYLSRKFRDEIRESWNLENGFDGDKIPNLSYEDLKAYTIEEQIARYWENPQSF